MAEIRIDLLGPPRLTRDGLPVTLSRRKAMALLAYLGVTRQSHSRDTLAALFWPDAAQSNARATLRRVLADINKALGEGSLELIGDTVTLSTRPTITIDVEIFRTILVTCQIYGPITAHTAIDIPQLTTAAELYQGDFLSGFTLPDCRAFDEWQFFQTESLQRDFARALELLVHGLRRQQESEQAIHYTHLWADLDPLREEPQSILLQLYATTDRRSAALRQYERYATLVHEELGATPEPPLTALYELIRHGNLTEAAGQTTQVPSVTEISGLAPTATAASTSIAASTQKTDDEIRLVTVLAIGLGRKSDARWDRHPEEVAEAFGKLIPIIHETVSKYGGVVDRLIGDGLQTIFGTPTLHEDDAARAIQAALDIRQRAESSGLSITAGISTGRVYFSPVVMPTGTEVTAIGPVVTLALRLQMAAQTNDILISTPTYRYNRATVAVKTVPLQLPDNEDPLLAYAVTHILPPPEQERMRKISHTKLVGREDELATLRQLLHHVYRGQGRVVSIIGEAGLGSTRLIGELKRWAIATGVDAQVNAQVNAQVDVQIDQLTLISTPSGAPVWLESHCLPLKRASSYWPFTEILQEYLMRTAAKSESNEQALTTTLVELSSGAFLTPSRADEIETILTDLFALQSNNDWDDHFHHSGSEQIRHQTFLAIYDFLVALSHKHPLTLVFEDLQWADDLSLDLLAFLLEAVPANPLFLICAYRPYWQRKRWRFSAIAYQKCPGAYTELWLRELTPEQSRQLIASLLADSEPPEPASEPPEEVVIMVQEKARGNPFFIREAVNALIEAGTLQKINGQWQQTAELSRLSLPESVHSMILSRIDLLSTPLRRLLRTAAVIGRIFPVRVLARLLPAEIDLDASLSALEDVALIYRERTVPEEIYSFSHLLTQESVYRTNARRQRRKLHEQVANVIEELYADSLSEHYEQLAHHYVESEARAKAIDYLLKAGEKSRRTYLNGEARHYYHQALNYLSGGPSDITHNNVAQSDINRNGAQTQNAAMQLLPPTEQVTCLSGTNNDENGVTDPREPLGRAVRNSLFAYQRSTKETTVGQTLAALTGLGQIYHAMGLDHAEEAEAYLREAIRVGRQAGATVSQLIRLYYWLGELLFWQGRYREQVQLGELGLHLLTDSQAESLEAVLMHHLVAVAERRQGHEELYAATVLETARFIERLPYSEELRPAYMHIINLQMIRDSDLAKVWLDRVETLAQRHHDLRALAELQDYRWLYAFQRGDLKEANALIPRGIALYTQIGDKSRVWRAWTNQVWTLLLQGNLVGAQEAAEETLDTAHALQLPRLIAESYLDLGLVLAGRQQWDEAMAAFQRVLQIDTELTDFWGGWAAACCLGRLRLRQGDRDGAQRFFAEAATRYMALSALGWRQKWTPTFHALLKGLEETNDDPAQLHRYCGNFQQARGQVHLLPLPEQYGLVPMAQDEEDCGAPIFHDHFIEQLADGWRWVDPLADCTMQIGDGLLLRAANGRDLWYMNRSAPRLVRRLYGQSPTGHPARTEDITVNDFMVQTSCRLLPNGETEQNGETEVTTEIGEHEPKPVDAPAIGGLLLWRDAAHFLTLTWGNQGQRDIVFGGMIANQTIVIGRGLLPEGVTEQKRRADGSSVHLRLVRSGEHIAGECSPDGTTWFTVGSVAFPATQADQIGIYATGWIDRMSYPGAYREGSAIRFTDFVIW